MDINDFINNNRQQFDNDEPSAEHIQRFAARIGYKNQTRFRLLRLAASVALIVTLGIGGYFYSNKPSRTNNIAHNTETDYAQTTAFYETEVQHLIGELENMNCYQNEKQQILNDVEALNIQFGNLQKELVNNTDNERLQNALIQNCRLRLSLLNKVLLKVKRSC